MVFYKRLHCRKIFPKERFNFNVFRTRNRNRNGLCALCFKINFIKINLCHNIIVIYTNTKICFAFSSLCVCDIHNGIYRIICANIAFCNLYSALLDVQEVDFKSPRCCCDFTRIRSRKRISVRGLDRHRNVQSIIRVYCKIIC